MQLGKWHVIGTAVFSWKHGARLRQVDADWEHWASQPLLPGISSYLDTSLQTSPTYNRTIAAPLLKFYPDLFSNLLHCGVFLFSENGRGKSRALIKTCKCAWGKVEWIRRSACCLSSFTMWPLGPVGTLGESSDVVIMLNPSLRTMVLKSPI